MLRPVLSGLNGNCDEQWGSLVLSRMLRPVLSGLNGNVIVKARAKEGDAEAAYAETRSQWIEWKRYSECSTEVRFGNAETRSQWIEWKRQGCSPLKLSTYAETRSQWIEWKLR